MKRLAALTRVTGQHALIRAAGAKRCGEGRPRRWTLAAAVVAAWLVFSPRAFGAGCPGTPVQDVPPESPLHAVAQCICDLLNPPAGTPEWCKLTPWDALGRILKNPLKCITVLSPEEALAYWQSHTPPNGQTPEEAAGPNGPPMFVDPPTGCICVNGAATEFNPTDGNFLAYLHELKKAQLIEEIVHTTQTHGLPPGFQASGSAVVLAGQTDALSTAWWWYNEITARLDAALWAMKAVSGTTSGSPEHAHALDALNSTLGILAEAVSQVCWWLEHSPYLNPENDYAVPEIYIDLLSLCKSCGELGVSVGNLYLTANGREPVRTLDHN